MLGGMVNSVDPDQTAPSGAVWFGSALLSYGILSGTLVFKISGHLPNLHVSEVPHCSSQMVSAHFCGEMRKIVTPFI